MRTKSIAIFTSLILTMLVTGVFWGTWFTLTRRLDDFPPDSFIRIGKTIIANVGLPMRILMPMTLASLLWLCLLASKQRPAFYFFIGSFLLMAVTLAITVGVEVPIDNQIKTWTVETIPENWTAIRSRWNSFHTMRTFTGILSFAALTIGVVMLRDSDSRAGFIIKKVEPGAR